MMAWNRQTRKLNVRLVVGLLLAVVLLPVAVQLAHVFQVTRSARVMLFRAEKAYAEGKTDEAIRCYKYYVNYQPDDWAVFTRLAILSTDRARVSRNRTRELWLAYPLLEQAAHHDPNNAQVVQRLVDVSLELGRLAAAVGYLERLVAASPRNADLHYKLGRSLVAVQDYRRALDTLQRSIALDATNVPAYVELADLLRERLSRPQHADETMDQAVKANPKSAAAYLEHAKYTWRTGRRDQALADIARAGSLAPDDLDVLLVAADFALQRTDYPTAQKHLEHAQRVAPNDERVDRLLITLRMNLGQIEAAIRLLQKVIEREPDDLRSLLTLCDLQLRRSDVAAARATMRRMEKARFARHILEYFEARLLMVEGRWREACNALEQLRAGARRSADITKQINLYLAVCYEQLGQPDRQMETYQRLVALDPNLLSAHIGLAAALFQAHKNERAMEEHRKLWNALRPQQFVRSRLLRNNYYQLLVGQIARQPAEQRDWAEVERYVRIVEETKEVDSVDAVLMRADLLNRQGKSAAARNLLAEKERQFPQELRLRTARAVLTGVQDPEQALVVLGPAGATLGDSVELRLARAGLAARLGAERARPLLQRLEDGAERFSRDDQVKLWRGLGFCYYQLRDRHHTKRLWRRVADARPDDRQIRMLLFDSAREASDEAGMLEALQSFEKLLGRTSAEWKYCEAARLIWQVRNRPMDRQLLSTASRYLKQAAALRPMWQRIPCLEAELAVMEGRLDEALQEFRRANDLGALNPGDLGQYVRLLYVRGRYELARDMLRKATMPDQSQGMKMLGSELELRTGNRDQSLELAAASALGSQNPLDHQWYGQFLVRAGRPADAETAFRRAVALGPQIPELWLSLIQHLAATGKRQQALDVMRTAQLLLPEDRVPLILGQSFEALGDLALAEQYYVSGAALYPENFGIVGEVANFFVKTGRLRRALPYLDQLLNLGAARNLPGDRAPLVWARRLKASFRAAEGGYRQQEEALRLLEENTVDGRLTADDMVVKASILATRPLLQSQHQAVQLLEQARREVGRLNPRYQVLLAQLYDATGRPALAESQMIASVRENPDDSRSLAALVQFLSRRQAAPETIEPWLARLEKKEPKLPVTIGTRARLLVRGGQTARGVALLQGMVTRPLDRAQLTRARYVAGVLEELGQHDAARKMLQEVIAVDPSGRLDLAEMLGRRGAVAEGLDQCDLARKSLPIARVMPTALAILNAAKERASREDFRRVESWFHAPGNDATAKATILQLANLLDLQGRFPELIRLYQDFLARTDVGERERAVVYNNLVYLLATQKKDTHTALEMIQQAIAVLGPSPQLRDTRGLALLANGQNREAVAEFRQVVADQPTGLNYFHLALALAAANDLSAAEQALRLASKNHKFTIDHVPALERDSYQTLVARLGRR
jgi:tetratricopeptide (TPR) repeat protein